MAYKVYAVPNFRGTALDLLLCNAADPNSAGVVHYAYTVGAEDDAVLKRTFPWAKTREFSGAYGTEHPETIKRLRDGIAYRPGEGVLDSEEGPTAPQLLIALKRASIACYSWMIERLANTLLAVMPNPEEFVREHFADGDADFERQVLDAIEKQREREAQAM